MKKRTPTQSEMNLLNMEETKKIRVNNQVFFSASMLASKSVHVRSSASILRRSISDSVERNICRRVGLHQACKEGLVDVVKKILRQAQSAINNLDETGYAPLHYASRYERTQIAELLIENGADLNICTSGELRLTTPLHLAARFNAYSIVRMLIEKAANIDQRSAFGQHALHYAARRGSVQLVKLFLDEGHVSAQVTDNEHCTPLHVACQSGRLDVVEILLNHGADPCEGDIEGCTALHVSAKEGRAEILRLLLKTATTTMGMSCSEILNIDGQYTNSCLHIAVHQGHVEAAKVCIEYGADASLPQRDMSTPLHIACTNGDYEMARLLVTYDVPLDVEDAEGMTPILRASLAGHVKIIDYLLNEGVDISPFPGSHAPSPLLCAVKRGHHEAVTHLLQRGSTIHLRDTSDRTALHIAVYSADAKTVSILLENGGKDLLQTRERDGKSPMHYAAAKGDIRIIQQLLEAGSSVDHKDEEERIPLHYAAENGNLCCVQALLNSNPSTVDEGDARLSTSLTYAAAGGHNNVVKYLLDNGADADTRDYDRITPLLYVSRDGCTKTAKVLLDYGAKINATDKNRFTALVVASTYGNDALVTLLLNSNADMSIITTSGQNCLTSAIDAGRKNVCMAIIKHKRWEEACKCDLPNGCSPVKRLIERFPDVAKIVMDKCITKSDHQESDENFQVTYNYKYLDPPPPARKNSFYSLACIGKKFFAPKVMLQNNRNDLLFHPLTLELIRYKWRLFGLRFFYLAAIIHLIFLVVITFYVQCQNDYYLYTFYNRTGKSFSSSVVFCNKNTLSGAELTISILSIFNLCIEVYQMYAERWDYIDTSNVVELLTYSCAMVALGVKYLYKADETYWTFTVILVLLAYLTMLLQFQSLFQTGIYVTMLFEVLKTLLRVVVVFAMLFYAYAVVFQLLLSRESNLMFKNHRPKPGDLQKDPFASVASSFLKVMVMTIGEIEYTRFFVDEPLALPNLSRWVFLSFCVFLPIVLMNLTIGLAVGDIDSIQKNAELKRLAIQIDCINEFEEKLPCWIHRRFYKSEAVKKPNEKPKTFSQKIKNRLSNRLLCTTSKAPEGSSHEQWDHVTGQLTNKMQAHEERMEQLTIEIKQQRGILEKILYSVTKGDAINESS